MGNVKTRAFSILLGLELSSICLAQVKLPPITIQSRPVENTGAPSLSTRAQKEVLGTLKQPDTEPQYLGTHWSDRFSQVSLFDMSSRTLSIPALDLGLLDLTFFPSFSEVPLASELQLNLFPKISDPLEIKSIQRGGTDGSAYSFFRSDLPIQDKRRRLRIQMSQWFSGQDLSFYDDRQTFFTSADDQIRTDPRTGLHRFQISATHQYETATYAHNQGVLYVFKHENLLPYPPAASTAYQDRQLALGHGSAQWQYCSWLQTPCEVSMTGLWYQSALYDPDRNLFLGIDQQHLNHGDLSLQLKTNSRLDKNFTLSPQFILQGALTEHRSTDLRQVQTTIPSSRLQVGAHIDTEISWEPWVWTSMAEIRGISDSTSGQSVFDHTFDLGSSVHYILATHHDLWTHINFSQRLPSFYERFGSFGTIRGNPNLKSEQHWMFQIGATQDFQWRHSKIHLHTMVFTNIYQNLIHFLPNAQLVHIPQNISSAYAWGSQALATYEFSVWSKTSLKMNWIHPREIIGNRSVALPGISELGISASQTFIPLNQLSVWVGMDFQSGLSFDSASERAFPSSWIYNAGAKWNLAGSPFTLQLDVQNIFNQLSGQTQWPGVADTLTLPILQRWGLPQQGRVVFLSLLLTS